MVQGGDFVKVGFQSFICLFGTFSQPLPAFRPKIVYSYVIEVADSESDLGLCNRCLVSEIFAFYHLQENALRRPGRRGHVHLVPNNACLILLICNSAPPMDFLRCLCEPRASTRHEK